MAVYELEGLQPRLGRDVFVADSAVVADVDLGDQTSVLFGAVVPRQFMTGCRRIG